MKTGTKRLMMMLTGAVLCGALLVGGGVTAQAKGGGHGRGGYSGGEIVSDTSSFIGEEAAQNAALAAAGVTSADVTNLTASLSSKSGVIAYRVSFTNGDMRYSYRIDAESGSVLSSSEGWGTGKGYVTDENGNVIKSKGQRSADTEQTTLDTSTFIGESAAKAAALEKAGVSESSISAYLCTLKTRGSSATYGVSFTSGGKQYRYSVDAVSGEVTSYEIRNTVQ